MRGLMLWGRAVPLLLCAMGASIAGGATADDDFVPPADLTDGWYARIDTSLGRIVARLLPDQAPQSVAHFAALAEGRLEWLDPASGEVQRDHYYDGIPVHFALAGLRFEAGDHHGTGAGAPEIYIPEEGVGPGHYNAPGRLGMTRAAGRISGVQFFVTASATPSLNPTYPCFGVVVSGLDVVRSITTVKTYSNHRPIDPPVLERVRVFAVGDPAPLPQPVAYTPHQVPVESRRPAQTAP